MTTFPSTSQAPVPNFPPPLSRNDNYNLTFPADILNNDKRKFYTQIQFVDYFVGYQTNLYTTRAIPTGGLKLPIPLKVDDNLVLQWSAVSVTQSIAGMATSALSNVPNIGGFLAGAATLVTQGIGIGFGVAANPLLFMQFQRPDFRQFSLSWILTPRNEKESQTIKDIVTACKKAASPSKGSFFGGLMGYPNVALIKMHPNDLFGHMVFKPCIIRSVQASYTGAPTAAFFKSGAPAAVTLTLNLQELQFWFREEIT